MSFIKRLFGLTDDRRGESMTGTVYTQINDTTVVTSDGDVFTRI
ncbi:MAG: hypothetical protein RLZZ395_2273 [Pseudomonadota bacterium]